MSSRVLNHETEVPTCFVLSCPTHNPKMIVGLRNPLQPMLDTRYLAQEECK